MEILVGESTPTAFGRKCKIDGKTVKAALDGKIPSQSILNKISAATGKSVEWIIGIEQPRADPAIQNTSEPSPSATTRKYEHLIWKFQHVFDFLLETHGDDAIAINDFISKMEKEFLLNDPDFRLWMYQKREKAAERKKKRAAESYPDEPMDIISANGE